MADQFEVEAHVGDAGRIGFERCHLGLGSRQLEMARAHKFAVDADELLQPRPDRMSALRQRRSARADGPAGARRRSSRRSPARRRSPCRAARRRSRMRRKRKRGGTADEAAADDRHVCREGCGSCGFSLGRELEREGLDRAPARAAGRPRPSDRPQAAASISAAARSAHPPLAAAHADAGQRLQAIDSSTP